MKSKLCVGILFFSFLVLSCTQQKAVTQNIIDNRPIAFPGAEGFGKYTTGGRGGKVVLVTNLNDDGEGSLRKALKTKGPKVIVFTLSGTIHLETKLNITSDVTIAGQTAPGDGICLADYPVAMVGNNIIVRYLRFRMGDKAQKGGMINGNGGDDAFGGLHNKNVVVDHCTMSWSTDEAFSVYAGDSTTLQWNLISEPLNFSYHFETGDSNYEHHGYGGIWGGAHATFHHNLFAHCANRTPRFDGARNIQAENCDFRNNVIYNWANNNTYAGEGGTYNIVNNYYKPGPATAKSVQKRIVNPYKKPPTLSFGKFYVAGNYVDGAQEVTNDNWLGVVMNEGMLADAVNAKLKTPFETIEIKMQPAVAAYMDVLKSSGASFRRDTLDDRIIKDVRNRTGRLIDVQGGYAHGTDYAVTKNAWPFLKSEPPPVDTDKDGMPDAWEKQKGLNPNDALDAQLYTINKHYTNIEVYINSLVP